jgi:hypothetical protein
MRGISGIMKISVINRYLHHHVFDMDLPDQIFRYLNFELLLNELTKTDFITAGEKN